MTLQPSGYARHPKVVALGGGHGLASSLSALKLLKSDPAAVLAQSEDIKARYTKLFKV